MYLLALPEERSTATGFLAQSCTRTRACRRYGPSQGLPCSRLLLSSRCIQIVPSRGGYLKNWTRLGCVKDVIPAGRASRQGSDGMCGTDFALRCRSVVPLRRYVEQRRNSYRSASTPQRAISTAFLYVGSDCHRWRLQGRFAYGVDDAY